MGRFVVGRQGALGGSKYRGVGRGLDVVIGLGGSCVGDRGWGLGGIRIDHGFGFGLGGKFALNEGHAGERAGGRRDAAGVEVGN